MCARPCVVRSRGHGRPRPSDGRRQARQALSHRGADRGPGSRNAAVSPRIARSSRGCWSGRHLLNLLQLFYLSSAFVPL